MSKELNPKFSIRDSESCIESSSSSSSSHRNESRLKKSASSSSSLVGFALASKSEGIASSSSGCTSNAGVSHDVAFTRPVGDTSSIVDDSKSKSRKQKKTTRITPTSGNFIPTIENANTGKSELNVGILHLYRDAREVEWSPLEVSVESKEPHNLVDTISNSESITSNITNTQLQVSKHKLSLVDQSFPPDSLTAEALHFGTVLCVLAVPSYITIQDYLLFVGPFRDCISHFRIIKDTLPNRYMVLMKFRDSKSAWEFYKSYVGLPFSSLEPEICHVVYIKDIEFKSQAMPSYAFPPMMDDPSSPIFFTSSPPVASKSSSLSPTHAIYSSNLSIVNAGPGGKGPTPVAIPDLIELPTCPVCLERMDASVTGLLTILCHHTFHCTCLSKWGDSSCPVCRYSSMGTPILDAEDSNECLDCGTTENLWICLICGNIGCGRYQGRDAHQHFVRTNHVYSLELETQRVWDYIADGYVHRLIQNKADGKLVELPAPGRGEDNEATERHGKHLVTHEKLDAIGLEYSYLLTNQLESQRLFYEQQIAAVQQSNLERFEVLSIRVCDLERDRNHYKDFRIPELHKEKKTLDKKLRDATEKLHNLDKQYSEEREMSSMLLLNQSALQANLVEKEAEVVELKDQVRDLMFFLEANQRVEASPMKDEFRSGTIVMDESNGSNSGSSHNNNINNPRTPTRRGRKK